MCGDYQRCGMIIENTSPSTSAPDTCMVVASISWPEGVGSWQVHGTCAVCDVPVLRDEEFALEACGSMWVRPRYPAMGMCICNLGEPVYHTASRRMMGAGVVRWFIPIASRIVSDTPEPDPDTNSTFLLAYLTLTSITHIVHEAVYRTGLRLNPTPGPTLSNPHHTTVQARALKLKRTVKMLQWQETRHEQVPIMGGGHGPGHAWRCHAR